MKKNHMLSRLTSLGLTAILLVLTAFSMWATLTTQQAADRTILSEYFNDQYQQARLALDTENLIEHKYLLDPAPEALAAYNVAASGLIKALHNVYNRGDAHDRLLVEKVLATHQLSLMNTHLKFMAVDNGDVALALNIDDTKIDPIFTTMQHIVNAEANRYHAEADQRLNALSATEYLVFIFTLIVFPIGLFLLGGLLLVVRTYQRKIDEGTSAEMARLARTALTDNLTGLGNHRAFQDDLQREMASACQQGETMALAIIDIDELKLINDTSGHLQGDLVLTTFATILQRTHHSEYIYRLGGDEFAMILPHITQPDAVTALEQLRHGAEQGLFGATISIGVAVNIAEASDIEVLQEQAHLAAAEAKRRSHNTIVTFEDMRESVSLIAPAKVHALHRLLSEGHVTVAFQPIWDIEQNRVLSFEALTRPPADYGFNGPQEAFDIAEKIGRAHELDYLCVHAILARAAELPPDTLLFLNLTPQTLDHDVLTGAILLEAVLSAGLTPDRVVIEITERSVVRLEVVVREARKLRALGFRLALDDTGAGNAGLEMLSQLAVDFVKIDRAIVVKALTDATARTIFTSITDIARQMNSYVIAEGIEDIEMLDLVQQVGAHAVQGYLLGRPNQVLPSAETLQALSPAAQRASLEPLTTAR
ncbi:MAG: bifunctional diguanylate cyclase/phosphodiesterase [Ktedonobacteraceae bacterium]|nr:bifunctional diguanylate cyclase/phosphodiesterase [Ktedonobacteraceae bacterium]